MLKSAVESGENCMRLKKKEKITFLESISDPEAHGWVRKAFFSLCFSTWGAKWKAEIGLSI